MSSRLQLTALALLSFPPLPAQAPVADPLLRWMDNIAQQQLQVREGVIAKVRTVSDAERRKVLVRQKILEALGGLPDYTGPLNARVTGQIQADGYVIEKVIYESLPGYYVTANLYRPSQPGRYPGVLLQAGHTQEGKAEPQRLAANLALKGFVSLAFDPSAREKENRPTIPNSRPPRQGGPSMNIFMQGLRRAWWEKVSAGTSFGMRKDPSITSSAALKWTQRGSEPLVVRAEAR